MTRPLQQPEIATQPPRLSPEAQAFLDNWRALRHGSGRIPPKTAFDPTRIPALLPQVVLYERRARDDFHIRLIGTAVVERIGREATGANVLELIAAEARGLVAQILNRVLDAPCGHASVVEDVYPSGRRQQVEVIRLPLADADGTARFIVSLTQPLDVVGYADRGGRPTLLAQPVESRFFVL